MAGSNLALRVISSLVMAPIAIFLAWLGGWPFALFWAAAALLVLYEWSALVSGANGVGELPHAVTHMQQPMWLVAGVAYAGAMLVATLLVRSDPMYGFAAVIFVFAVVWLTDIAAYFVGRALGGPKLMPRVSPSKTWSGALGGAIAAMIGGALVAKAFGLTNVVAVSLVAFFISVVAQAGDLLESALKRSFHVKDSSQLLPGHGGIMDRLDGYTTAVVAAALIGLARGGMASPARGFLVW